MTIYPRAQSAFSYTVQSFFTEDSASGLEYFKRKWTWKLTDGDCFGFTPLMLANFYGNVAIVSHLVKCMDKNSLNYFSETGMHILVIPMTKWILPKINKIIECTQLLLGAGVDVNAVGDSGLTPLDYLVDTAGGLPNEDWKQLVPLVRVYIKAGAYCTGLFRYKSPVYRQAAVVDWSKMLDSVRLAYDALPEETAH
jgi:hypothetical protein